MGEYNDEKLRMMEDEMNRFEAEIGIPVPPLLARPVIGVNTYNQVQRRLEEQQMPEYHPGMFAPPMIPILQNVPNVQGIPGFVGIPPPPPPPPPLLIPHQVQQRNLPPVRGAMIPPPTSFREMAPPPSQAPPPPRPQQQQQQPQFVGGPIAPPPPTAPVGSAVVSMAPMLYNPGSKSANVRAPKLPQSVDDTYASFQNELSRLSEPKPSKRSKMADKYESLRAKDMADKVKASIVATVTPVAPQPVTTTPVEEQPAGGATGRKKKNKKLVRMAGGQIWEDNSLTEWEDDDYRIFCGDLGNDVTDEILTRTFSKYTSFLKAKVVRDKRSNKTKGFGFVSFKDPQDFIKAMKEMNGRYVGSRPIKLRKSTWKSRNMDNVRKKEKEKTALIGLLTGR